MPATITQTETIDPLKLANSGTVEFMFYQLLESFGATDPVASTKWWNASVMAYASHETRSLHDEYWLQHSLAAMDQLAKTINYRSYGCARMAVWFATFHVDPSKTYRQNLLASTHALRECCIDTGVNERLIEKTVDVMNLTARGWVEYAECCLLFHDVMRMWWALRNDRYAKCIQLMRDEQGEMDDITFISNRGEEIVRAMAEKSIFLIPNAYKWWEKSARQNLRWEGEDLRKWLAAVPLNEKGLVGV